jgi:hypothetical protein
MASENSKIEKNYKGSMTGWSETSDEIRLVRVNDTTNRVLVENSALDSSLDSVGVKFYDEGTGTVKGLLFNADAPQICSQDYLYALAEGDISGHSPFEKLGYSTGATTTETDVWAASVAYVFPTSAGTMAVASSSASDGPAGTGVKSVRVWYLDSNYSEGTVDVELNGTGTVYTSVGTIYRVNAFRAVSFGSTSTTYRAIGNIDICAYTGTRIYSRLAIGATRARNSVYTVPAGKTMHITSMSAGVTKASTTGNTATLTLRATYDSKIGYGSAGLVFYPQAEMNLVDQFAVRPFELPITIPQKVDTKISVTAGQASTVVSTSLRGWLE